MTDETTPTALVKPLRFCGYCLAWQSKPCGDGCVWQPSMPTELPEAASSRERIAQLEARLAAFVDRMDRNGNWDDGCFYYNGRSATELQEPIAAARAALAEAAPAPSGAIADIAAERRRQILAEGFSAAHDDTHTNGQLAYAAACYALAAVAKTNWMMNVLANLWPWDWDWWKPSEPRRNLVKAAALIAAEIERLDRLASSTERNDVR